MEAKDRSLATTMAVGAWQCDTLLDRHGEIKHALYDDVSKDLEGGVGYVLATQHKTHMGQSYGKRRKLSNLLHFLLLMPRQDSSALNTMSTGRRWSAFTIPFSI